VSGTIPRSGRFLDNRLSGLLRLDEARFFRLGDASCGLDDTLFAGGRLALEKVVE
jgi:hypothetical protein